MRVYPTIVFHAVLWASDFGFIRFSLLHNCCYRIRNEKRISGNVSMDSNAYLSVRTSTQPIYLLKSSREAATKYLFSLAASAIENNFL